jgi:hypothetical protein
MPAQNVSESDLSKKLAEQDILGQSTRPAIDPESSDALDALAATVMGEENEVEVAPVVEPKVEPKVEPAAPTPEEKAAADAKAAEEAKAATTAAASTDKLFEGIELPGQARPKSAEAFAAIKQRAAAEIGRLETERKALEVKLAETEEKLKSPVPEEVTKELEELRGFRAKFDVELDPRFAKFDEQVVGANETAYTYMLKNRVASQATIDEIKKLGGLGGLDADAFLSTIKDATARRFVEGQLYKVEAAKAEKEQAIESAKTNIGDYTKARREELNNSSRAHNEEVSAKVTDLVGRLPWMTLEKLKDSATEEEKKAFSENEKFVKEVREQVEVAATDGSPEMRAVLVAGFAQLLNTQRAVVALQSQLAAAKTETETLNTKLARYTKASTSRLRESAAAPVGTPGAAKKVDLTLSAGESLDAIAAQVMASRQT